MSWIKYSVCALFAIGSLQANLYDFEEGSSEMFAEEEDFMALDSEIEALLEEDGLVGMEDYDQLEQYGQPTREDNEPRVEQVHASVAELEVEEIQASSLPIEVEEIVAAEEPMVVHTANPLEMIQEEAKKSVQTIEINLKKVFSGSPIIYSVLFLLSTLSVCVWLYSMLTIRSVDFLPPKLVKDLRAKLISNQFDEALDLCVKQRHFFCKMLASGILARKHGLNVMVDTMKAEGKRSTISFWQRIGILNEIAIIAPMLGLLGTVMGMFYAFYDLNRSIESVSLLFDGLGISVGTTVAGLIVAILAMILHSMAKYRLVRILANVENEAQVFAALIDTRGPTT